MDGSSFGTVIARVIAEMTVLIEGTLSQWVNITVVDGNITSIGLSPLGEEFCWAFSKLAVSYCWAMDQALRALYSVT